jgi:hypothetical protein
VRLTRAELSRLPRAAEALGVKHAPEPSRRGRMSKWERSFHDEVLEPWRRERRIECVRFEGLTLTLYDGSTDVRKSRYTPDFVTWHETAFRGRWAVEVYEVKGRRRRETMEKLKNAAQQYPWIRFHLCTGGPGRWEIAVL